MMALAQSETYQGSALASWDQLFVLLGLMAAVVVALALLGRRRVPEGADLFTRVVLLVPRGMERVTGATGAGWAVSMFATACYGLLIAGQGFYSDVAWHVALGRDEELFTAPHTAIIVGLVMIALSPMVGVLVATVERAEVGFRLGALHVPWSALPLAALGTAAVAGFPLDEVWHAEYGIDVTMWSPTHMLMIMGATFTGVAAWMVLAEAGIAPGDSRWARVGHVVAAVLVVLGLAAPQGEFNFGVPQFQAIFAPILVSLAGAGALVAGRLVMGRWWMLGVVTGLVLLDPAAGAGDESPVETRRAGTYIVSALWVEAVAWVLGTERRLRFAVVSGLGIGTVGLAGEWWWNQGAKQPWQTSMLPDAVILATVGALGAALVSAALGSTLRRERPTTGGLHPALIAAGAVAVVVVMAIPMARQQGAVTADVSLEEAAEPGTVHVHVAIDPEEVEDARWFQTLTWQNGGLVISEMTEVEPGHYRSEHAHDVTGLAKTMLRLHRGGELMSIPIHLPADPEIGESEVPAVDRPGARFDGEKEYLLRETRAGNPFFSRVIYGVLFLAWIGWAGGFAVAATRIGRLGDAPDDTASRPAPAAPHPDATQADDRRVTTT